SNGLTGDWRCWVHDSPQPPQSSPTPPHPPPPLPPELPPPQGRAVGADASKEEEWRCGCWSEERRGESAAAGISRHPLTLLPPPPPPPGPQQLVLQGEKGSEEGSWWRFAGHPRHPLTLPPHASKRGRERDGA
ncbi:unnamed protein product, partial [Closterium sp. NIES-53]